MDLNHYQVLEIDQKATSGQIRKKYLEMAILYHPDRNRHLSQNQYLKIENKFQQVTRAFHVLSDPIEKSKYDFKISRPTKKEVKKEPFCAYQSGSYSFNVSPILLGFANQLFSNQKIQNIKDFIKVFGQFSSASDLDQNDSDFPEIIRNYKTFFQKKKEERAAAEIRYQSQMVRKPRPKMAVSKPQPRQPRGPSEPSEQSNISNDLIYTANVSLRDIYLNVPKELNVPRKKVCHHCIGVGYLGYGSDMSLCQICKGIMIITDSKIFPINIKETKLVFPKEGHQNLGNDPSDLIIHVQPKPHEKFRRINQYDLLYLHQITFLELYQTLQIQLEHLDGKSRLINYSNSDTNALKDQRLLRVKDEGLPITDDGRRGDLYIKLEVQFPDLDQSKLTSLQNLFSCGTSFDTDSNPEKNNEIEIINLQAELPAESYQIDT